MKLPARIGWMMVGALILLSASAWGQEENQFPPVSIPGTEVRCVQSSQIGQEFKLHIYLPPGYQDTTRTFPVVYLTDSDAYFGFVRSLAGNLLYGNMIPEIIVVGIAYQEDVASYLRKRERDLLPAEVAGHAGSGNAAMFLEFLSQELLPFVESHYRADSGDRTIMGMSAGATFAAYVLFQSPQLFDRYVIVSPYFIYGQDVVLELEKAYAQEHDSLHARVYTAMGSGETECALGPWKALFENAREHHYSGLDLTNEVLDGISHLEVVFSAYVKGLKTIFAGRIEKIKAAPAHYGECAGTYEIGTVGIRFTIRQENNRLYISRSGEYWDELIPASDTKFAVESNAEVQFSFMADHTGTVVKMIIYQLGMETPARKVM